MHSSAGVSDDTIVTSGANSNVVISNTMIYNGENWSIGSDILVARHSASLDGISSNSILHGGMDIRTIDNAEKFNGQEYGVVWLLEWIVLDTHYLHLILIVHLLYHHGGDIGSSVSNLTEKFNGEIWDILSSINMKRKYFSASGNGNTTLIILGDVFDSCSTEIFTDQIFQY